MNPSALVLFLLQAPAQEAPARLPAPIAEVTVYPESAVVRRRGEVPGPGTYTVEGLPRSLDPAALRVRGVGVEIVRAELRERVRGAAPDPRVEGLRAELAEVKRGLQDLAGERDVQRRIEEHLTRLLAPDPAPLAALAQPAAEAPSLAAFDEELGYLERQMTGVRARDRALAAAERALAQRRDALALELAGLETGAGVAVHDLLLDVFGPAGAAAVEIDYAVPGAGWAPVYDLRAARDLQHVELVYRARVWQRTGEDWRDVELVLSTAEPRRGAQGPEPGERWVALNDPRVPTAAEAPPPGSPGRPSAMATARARGEAAPPFASVEDEGLSVRFRLPGRETIEARGGAGSTVLVGRAQLKIEPERACVPALDPAVWLSARARNTSDFVLFRGRAGIFFGADFIGHADLPAVQRNEEFTLPLGLDPNLTVERVLLSDQSSEPGMFGSKRTVESAWRIALENHGAVTSRPDGAVEVRVHESLPRASDDRIEIELERARPEPAGGERWKKLREERGVLTWLVSVPRGGASTIEVATSVSYPAKEQLVRRIEQ